MHALVLLEGRQARFFDDMVGRLEYARRHRGHNRLAVALGAESRGDERARGRAALDRMATDVRSNRRVLLLDAWLVIVLR